MMKLANTGESFDNLSYLEIIERYLAEYPDANKEPKEKQTISKFQIYFVRPYRWNDTKFANIENGFSLMVQPSVIGIIMFNTKVYSS